jgi:MtN3 and saliva related transmembrane protein
MQTEMWWDVVGVLAAACTSGGLIPQLVRGVRTQRLDDVSPGLLILLIVGCALWFLYGMHKWDKIIMGANAFVIMLSIIIFSLRAHYIRQRSKRL